MKRHIKYPSINQFRGLVKDITERACCVGQDDENNPIFDYLKPKPTVVFIGTVKTHGTNASVCFSEVDGFWAQSKEQIITTEKDNAGFAFFAEKNKDILISIIKKLAKEKDINLNTHIVTLYGEFIGKGVQNTVAICELTKRFIIFANFKVSTVIPDIEEKSVWYETCEVIRPGNSIYVNWLDSKENDIYNAMNFKTCEVIIDFNEPERAVNTLTSLMEEVENECPVAKEFGISGIGEGIVISKLFEDGSLIQAKIKGEKHSAKSKVRTLNPIDLEKLDKIDKCVEEICHNWRFEQGLTEIFGVEYHNNLDRKKLGNFIKWVANDTIKEESDIIAEYGFEPKDVLGKVSQKAKEYYFSCETL